METNDLVKTKKVLEKEVRKLVEEFEKKTFLSVEIIYLNHLVYADGSFELDSVNAMIELK